MAETTARLILVCGLPGAGKTTLARQLEREIPGVRLCPDEWLTQLGIDLFEDPPRDALEALFWQLAQSLLALGHSVILESGFWLRSDRDEKRLGARALGVVVELRFLDVPLEERWRRIQARNAEATWGAVPITRKQLVGWDQSFEPPGPEELALFDPDSRPAHTHSG